MRTTKSLVGKRFGKLIVLKLEPIRKCGKRVWSCACDCGGAASVTTGHLTNGWSGSCGCRARRPSGQGHGHTAGGKPPPEYAVWCHMKQRCSNPNDPDWHSYGGRGIKVCAHWEGNFQAFLNHVGPRPSTSMSLDRIDTDKDYEPGNTRWTTSAQQSRNTRRNRMLTFKGETMCMTDWADKMGLRKHTVKARLDRGWSVERALTEPLRRGRWS